MLKKVTPEKSAAHWRATRALMWFCLVIWAILGFGVHFFTDFLNGVTFLGFPLGFYMAAQGSLVVFVLLIFFFAMRQGDIDQRYDVAED